MLTGSIPIASTLATWSEDVEIWSNDDDTLMDLSTVIEATLKLRDPYTKFDEMTLKLSQGDITFPSTGIVQWRAEASRMGTLKPQLYEIVLLLQDVDDTMMLILGPVSVIS